MKNTPCTVIKDLPESGICTGASGILYDTEGEWCHVELQDRRGKPLDYAIIHKDDVRLEQ